MYLMHNIFNEPNWFLRNQKPDKTKKKLRERNLRIMNTVEDVEMKRIQLL